MTAPMYTLHELEHFKSETLAWCNAQRDIRGDKPLTELPKGVIGDPSSCPCGKATGLEVGIYQYRSPEWEENEKMALPTAVSNFVMCFDSRFYPDLVDQGSVNS